MNRQRRNFLRQTGLGSLAFFAGDSSSLFAEDQSLSIQDMSTQFPETVGPNMIGAYGPWAAGLHSKTIPSFSFRNEKYKSIADWYPRAHQALIERLGIPEIGGMPKVTVKRQYEYDGLHIEELSWSLPYGAPTDAILLKPASAKTPLPAILGFHDHGGNKYFGTRKITRTSDDQHPLMVQHQKDYYEGRAWANEIAKKGYVVLVPDAFPFASRRVLLKDVPKSISQGLNDDNPEDPKNIEAYNRWASEHEHVMSKSLFCSGTTWPGVFFAEDRKALDILCARNDVDKTKIGCAGLSGGGMRTVFMGGLDPRITCAVCVGFMTTWNDFLLNKSFTHTWMTYVPRLPNEMDFPEILGLRIPKATLVLNDTEDELYTMGEMKKADSMLAELYRKAGSPERYHCSYYPGIHKFDAAMQSEAFAWFDKWLKK